MKNVLTVPSVIEKETNVDSVVQEYMDSLLVDLFPQVEDVTVEDPVIEERVAEELVAKVAKQTNPMDRPSSFQQPKSPSRPFKPPEPRSPDFATQPQAVEKIVVKKPEVASATIIEVPVIRDVPHVMPNLQTDNVVKTDRLIKLEPEVEKRFPKAPGWAQEAFDILLFDVCGLKLAVPMESLGKIIKVERETNQLIGRPDWFIGAYNESDEHLYVVDTAKYIMPEKGYDLEAEGFAYLIQLQRSKWTLACKQVYTTVRIEPDQVKWRSSNGKRQWLSGTVIEHMCALIHVDKLIEILNADT
jgi:purine-binding chemotaxis protein CheW